MGRERAESSLEHPRNWMRMSEEDLRRKEVEYRELEAGVKPGGDNPRSRSLTSTSQPASP